MYTGIVQGRGRVGAVLPLGASVADPAAGPLRLAVQFPPTLMRGLQRGASVAVDGVCLSVVAMNGREVSFDLTRATLAATNLADRLPGDEVNLERSARQGAEIGGHAVSGHVSTTAVVTSIETEGVDAHLALRVPVRWARCLFERGFVALDGVSLTLQHVDAEAGTARVALIPDTLRRTALRRHRAGSRVNVEVDHLTQVVVDAIERASTAALRWGRLRVSAADDALRR
jgi:riboflavin synthase